MSSSETTEHLVQQQSDTTGEDPAATPAAQSSGTGDRSLRFLLAPRWLAFDLLVGLSIVAMINLGFWQLRRLDEVKTRNALIETRYDATPVPIGDLLPSGNTLASGDPALDDIQWRPITASGSYTGEQIRIVNRTQDGAAGWQALSPMELADGRILLVNRGFAPLNVDDLAAPTGDVALVGHLRVSQTKTFAGLSDPATGALDSAQRIDIERLSQQFDVPVVPMYVELTSSRPGFVDNGLPAPVHPPVLDEGNHLSYAIQWFCFAGAVMVGWVLAVRHSIRKRRATP